ncbi:unnamed protein product [Lupinus luteus]|uniref:RNase H type-1 domain-containing protein n=1 Tax=Lupinus luteus TaxID=3873 RepID=A0AAV1VXF7_LUPLU
MHTDENLQGRGLALCSMCSLCNSDLDSTNHLFFSCKFSISIWNWLSSQFHHQVDVSSLDSLILFYLKDWSPQLKVAITSSIVNSLAIVWFCRNKARFDNLKINLYEAFSMIKCNTFLTGNHSAKTARNSMLEFKIFKVFNVNLNCRKAPDIIEVLCKPPNFGWVKVNSDGAAIGCPGFAGGGGFGAYFGIQNSLYAEIMAAIVVVKIASHKGWSRIWLETDSTVLIDCFLLKKQVPWKLRNLWLKCLHSISLIKFKVSHIYREGNSCADLLANCGVKFKTDCWWNTTPSIISQDLNRNRNSLPFYRFRNL